MKLSDRMLACLFDALGSTSTHTHKGWSPRASVIEYTCETQYHIEGWGRTRALDTQWKRVLPVKLEFNSQDLHGRRELTLNRPLTFTHTHRFSHTPSTHAHHLTHTRALPHTHSHTNIYSQTLTISHTYTPCSYTDSFYTLAHSHLPTQTHTCSH